MAILFTAFLLGLVGSLHCAGMCGPIALSLPLRGESVLQKIWGSILWSLGRIVTYSMMGALFGLIGSGFKLLGFQQVISVVMGIVMIVSVILPSLFKKFTSGELHSIINPVRKGFQNLFREKNNKALFLIGIANGLLPCGLVYVAVAGAIGTADFLPAIGYMALFGLGTLPLLLSISLLGDILSQTIRRKINKAVPFVVVIIGIIFILRGLALGIPFLSPPKERLTPSYHQKPYNVEATNVLENSCCKGDSDKAD